MGWISGAMSGLGEGLQMGAKMYGEHASRVELQKEAEAAQKERDLRLAELQEQANIRSEDRKRAPYQRAAERSRGLINDATTYAQDVPGVATPIPPSEVEQTRLRARASEEEGLPDMASHQRSEAIALDRNELERKSQSDRREDRRSDNVRADRQLSELERHNKATEAISAAASGRLAEGAKLDNAIKQITLDNHKRVEGLRKEFASASPDRKKAIAEEIQIITGKDNDSYLPVPLKDADGNVTGYKVFDKKRGEWVEPKGASGEPSKPKTRAEVEALPDGALFINPADGKTYRKKASEQPRKKEPGAKPATAQPGRPGYGETLDRLNPRVPRPPHEFDDRELTQYP